MCEYMVHVEYVPKASGSRVSPKVKSYLLVGRQSSFLALAVPTWPLGSSASFRWIGSEAGLQLGLFIFEGVFLARHLIEVDKIGIIF